jgi:glycosyltransferase involved in cell wall biosynthesis
MKKTPLMIVDHLNTGLSGGAAIAARRLHRSLQAAGVESHYWYLKASPKEEETVPRAYGQVAARFQRHGPIGSALAAAAAGLRRMRLKWDKQRALAGRPAGLGLFNIPQLHRPTRWQPRAGGRAIVHLHWVAKMIDYPSFFASLPDDLPIVWTLHDRNPMTGGCHCPNACEAYTEGCGNCPQLGRRADDDLSYRSLRVKRDALLGKNLHVVAPSRWAADCARRSWLLGHGTTIKVIPHGLDLDVFAPQDKKACKRALGIAPERIVIGFGAASIADRHKGLRELLEALAQLANRERIVGVIFGGGSMPRLEIDLPELVTVGYLDDPVAQAMVYSAADLLVVPSREELFGLTGLESLACGTPVVGFDCGGIPDYVRPLETGLLARPDDSDDLAGQIQWLIDRPHARHQMGLRGRAMVLREFDLRQQAARHLELYQTLLHGAATVAATGRAA